MYIGFRRRTSVHLQDVKADQALEGECVQRRQVVVSQNAVGL